MCHQSGGLIQRAAEEAGIATTALTNLMAPLRRLRYPRAALVRFPRGATVGVPGDVTMQQATLRSALELLTTAQDAGEIEKLDFAWPEALGG